MAQPYDVHEIENRWRRKWEADGFGRLNLDEVDPAKKFYNLVEFPYPSAEGLHVGHVFKYSGADTFGRYQRMRGREVFQPIGFDAFGIHTENFALKQDKHPLDLTGRTTERFRAQLSRGGMAWDWSRVVDTSKPNYYRWTQWLLVRLFKAGLMYQAEAPVVWCPSCLTVLAREQTENHGPGWGRGPASGEEVGVGAPTGPTSRLTCERCQSVVGERVMRQWFLRITDYADRLLDGLDDLNWPDNAKRMQRQWIGRSEGREIDFGDITVFTTRPDTLAGVTFLAVAVGHAAAGSTRPHPLTGAAIPVYEADYVVETYGTGAVMGVPQHDDRDRRFAVEHGLAIVDAPLLSDDEVAVVGRPAIRYRLRDWLISRQRYWGPPIPIIHCEACGPVPVPEDQLPVVLPDVDDFRPTGTGVSPLAAADDWVKADCPQCGGPARRETDVSDTFVDSAWYFLRYPSTEFDDRPWDDERTARMLPVDFYAGGPEHVQRHHLYARFVTMALFDLGLVPFEEPFPRIRLGGLIVKDGARMSKSRGNVITPDEYVDRHGSDALRCSLLFSAPWEQGGDFIDDAIAGIERFFARAWKVVTGTDAEPSEPRAMHRAIAAVTDSIEGFHFNVGLARLMEFIPSVRSLDEQRTFVKLLAPFAPHLAEELWSKVADDPRSVHIQRWPEHDPAALIDERVQLVVQIDGKIRAKVEVASGLAADEAESIARGAAASHLNGRTVTRAVYVKDKLVNLVTVVGG